MTRRENIRLDGVDLVRVAADDRHRLDAACDQVGIAPSGNARADALAVLRALGVDANKSYSPTASCHCDTPLSERTDAYVVSAACTAAARAAMIRRNENAWRRDGAAERTDSALTPREKMIARNRSAWKR